MKNLRGVRYIILPAAVVLLAGGCGSKGSGNEAVPQAEIAVTVEVEEVAFQKVEDWIDLPGKIEPYKEVTVSAEVGGLLERLAAREGEAVSRGEELAVIDRENLELQEKRAALGLEQARIAVEQAGAALDSAEAMQRQSAAVLAQAVELEKKAAAVQAESERNYERGLALFEEQLAPRSRLDELKLALDAARADFASAGEGVKAAQAAVEAAAAGRKSAAERLAGSRSQEKSAAALLEQARLRLRKSTILSPLGGYVDLLFSEEGELVKDQDPLLRIVQTRPVKAVFQLPEKDVPFLRRGMDAAVTVEALSAAPRPGKVSLIGVTSDPATSTYRLEIDLPNGGGELRPGMLARLRLMRQSLDEAVAAPVFAVITEGKRSFVFLFEEGEARRREVATGIVDGDRIQILSGLAQGELLIVKGQRDLEDGQRIALP